MITNICHSRLDLEIFNLVKHIVLVSKPTNYYIFHRAASERLKARMIFSRKHDFPGFANVLNYIICKIFLIFCSCPKNSLVASISSCILTQLFKRNNVFFKLHTVY